jgi:MFS family permease
MSDSPPAPDKPKLWTVGTLTYTSGGIVVLFCWLLWGDFAWSMRERSVGPMASWYLKHIGVSNLLFGLLMSSFPAVVGLILGPIISVKSDRHRGKWGRRIPYLMLTTPIAAAGMLGLAFTPVMAGWLHDSGQTGLLGNEVMLALVSFGIFWAAFEFATIAGAAVLGGLINDVVPQQLLGRFYGLFRAVSLIGGMIFNFWIFGLVPQHYTLIMAVIAVFYGGAFMWVCFKVKEGEYPPPPPLPPRAPGVLAGMKVSVGSYFRESFTHAYYLWVFVMMMAAGVCFLPINVFTIPYAEKLGVSTARLGEIIALTYAISLVLAYPLGWMADKFHPLRVSIAAMAGYVIVTAWGFFYAGTSQTAFLAALVAHGVLSGTYFTSAASLGQRLFPHEKFAQFASAAGIIAAPAGIALAPVVGSIVDFTGDDYRYTFASACVLALIALWSAWHVHRQFMKLGGPKNYVAP